MNVLRPKSRAMAAAAALLALSAFALPLHAADVDLERRIRELERRIHELEGAKQSPQPADAPAAKTEAPPLPFKVTGGGPEGFTIGSADGAHEIRLGGYVQADGRFFVDDEAARLADQFLLRRVRLDVRGTLFRHVDFRVLPDFASSRLALQDAYLELKYFPAARIRVGKTKAPFGLERLQSGTALLFVERALATNLVPNRDIGAQVLGDLFGGTLSYAVGVFDGVPDGASGDGDVSDDKDLVGRVFAHPFKTTEIAPLAGLGVGIAGSLGRRDGREATPELPTYRSQGQATIFSFVAGEEPGTTAFGRGRQERFSPQGSWYFGPFGVLAEYVDSSYGVRLGDETADVDASSWQVTASWAVTGEAASDKGVVPQSAFDPAAGTWGALELVARAAALRIDDDVFDRGFVDPNRSVEEAESYGAGVNWYLNPAVKLSLDYETTGFDGGASGGRDRQREHFIGSRFQIVL